MINTVCKRSFIILVLSLFLVQGCGGTKITSVWKKSDFAGGPFKNILVIGMTKDQKNKNIWEDTMTDRLRQVGVNAVSGFTSFPGDMELSKEKIIAFVEQEGIDAVLVTRMVDIIVEKAHYPSGGRYSGAYYGGPHYRHYNNFDTYYDTAYRQGQTATFTSVYLETNLYDAATKTLIWSISSDTFDASTASKLSQDVSQQVIEAMQKDMLISPPK